MNLLIGKALTHFIKQNKLNLSLIKPKDSSSVLYPKNIFEIGLYTKCKKNEHFYQNDIFTSYDFITVLN